MINGVPFYSEGKDLLSQARRLWDKMTLAQAKAQLEKAENAFLNPNLHAFLKWKYKDEPVLERAGKIYPVSIYPAPVSQRLLPDSVLIQPLESNFDDNDLKPKDARYRALKERVTPTLKRVDRISFTMKELIIEDQIGMRCGLGSYYRAFDTCDSLEWEILSLATDLVNSDVESFKRFDTKLVLRNALHAQVDNPVRNGSHRSAAIGVSTLVAYHDGGTTNFLLKKRSETGVAVHANLVHVIPSHMFQPGTEFLNEEFSIVHDFKREYLEELFGRDEPESGVLDPRYFYGDPKLRYLQNLLNDNEADLYLTGITVNLLNLRPEVCLLLLIRTEDWYLHHSQNPSDELRFKLNPEYAIMSDSPLTKGVQKLVGRVRYKVIDDEQIKGAPLSPGDMVPPGAAAFWLGRDTLRHVL